MSTATTNSASVGYCKALCKGFKLSEGDHSFSKNILISKKMLKSQ